jgi:hypothetical protein
MLKQMGWKKGQGLGKEGTGIANPISAERYAQGAGLGSANAKSRTDGGGGGDTYKDRARELVRTYYIRPLSSDANHWLCRHEDDYKKSFEN